MRLPYYLLFLQIFHIFKFCLCGDQIQAENSLDAEETIEFDLIKTAIIKCFTNVNACKNGQITLSLPGKIILFGLRRSITNKAKRKNYISKK